MSEKPCPECGCVPSDAWGCECSNEDCPCSEEVDEAEMCGCHLPPRPMSAHGAKHDPDSPSGGTP